MSTATLHRLAGPRFAGSSLHGFEALPCADVLALMETHARACAEYREATRGACYAQVSLASEGGAVAITYLHGENFYFWRGHAVTRRQCLAAIAVAKLVACNQLHWED
ncbi:hypothetical protein BurMR1_3059 [Burkholderia sp. MR1]|nr:hypothetical protein BurMR1_3059 [Burkholderia sp. MR1]